MIKIENCRVYNFEGALRGMRNPLESWEKSDTICFVYDTMHRQTNIVSLNELEEHHVIIDVIVGEADKKLALKLTVAGSDHSKFLRQIFVCMDITAPIYWWKEFDTYKVATVANSTSTMHKLGSRLLTFDDFSWDKITPDSYDKLNKINLQIAEYRRLKNATNRDEKKVYSAWRRLIQDLPSSFNQKRTWIGNYEVLRNMYHARKNHKLTEWREFCEYLTSLPESEFITIQRNPLIST